MDSTERLHPKQERFSGCRRIEAQRFDMLKNRKKVAKNDIFFKVSTSTRPRRCIKGVFFSHWKLYMTGVPFLSLKKGR